MYSRNEDEDGADTTLGVSGKLWNGILVMYDRATGSLWTQIDGRAIEGQRLGERLEHLPSVYTTWDAWVARHPDTEVLDKTEEVRGFKQSRYAKYLADPKRLFRPELARGLGGVAPKDVVFGVRVEDQAAAVSEALLQASPVVNGLAGNMPIAWVRRAATGAVTAFDRRLDGRVLVLTRDGPDAPLRDALTGAVLFEDRLRSLRVDRAFWYAWKRTHPDSTILAR